MSETISAEEFWTEEPSNRPDRRKIRARIGGLHCSLCTGTIEKALGRQPGVDEVAVSLTHEQALTRARSVFRHRSPSCVGPGTLPSGVS